MIQDRISRVKPNKVMKWDDQNESLRNWTT